MSGRDSVASIVDLPGVPAIETGDRRASIRVAGMFLALFAALLAVALYSPINHDENQYVAGVYYGWTLNPYRDFLFLQPPGFPLIMGWLKAVSAGHLLITLRIANAVVGLGILLLAYAGLRQLMVSRGVSIFSCCMILVTQPFLFSAGVVRNDLLAAWFFAAAIFLLVHILSRSRERTLLAAAAGLSLVIAGLVKQSYFVAILPPVIALGWIAFARPQAAFGPRSFTAGLLGAAVGLVPLAYYAIMDWPGFYEGVLGYHLHGVRQWYSLMGHGDLTTMTSNLRRTLLWALDGPTFAAMVIVAVGFIRFRRDIRIGRNIRLVLFAAVAGALVAAILPTPSWPQYLVPVLVPLSLLLGVVLESLRNEVSVRSRRVAATLLGVGVIAGLVFLTVTLTPVLTASLVPTALAVDRDASRIAAIVRGQGLTGPVATLSELYVVDSGLPLYREFAPGPTFYRTADRLSDQRLHQLKTVAPRTLKGLFERHPPAAIIVGYERLFMGRKINLERGLEAYAVAHRYLPYPLPGAKDVVLYVRPHQLVRRPGDNPLHLVNKEVPRPIP